MYHTYIHASIVGMLGSIFRFEDDWDKALSRGGLHFALHVPSNSPDPYYMYAQVCRVLMLALHFPSSEQDTFGRCACLYNKCVCVQDTYSNAQILLSVVRYHPLFPPCGQCEFGCLTFSAVITTFLALPLSSVKRLNAPTRQTHPPSQSPPPPREPSSGVESVLTE
jgi:hypothetical protein